jgi:hypothetical protein
MVSFVRIKESLSWMSGGHKNNIQEGLRPRTLLKRLSGHLQLHQKIILLSLRSGRRWHRYMINHDQEAQEGGGDSQEGSDNFTPLRAE